MDFNPDSATPPPPQRPPLTLRDRPVRLAGILLACSTPITGFLSYALVAILFGESRLEGSDGLTGVGVVALIGPAILGTLLVLWSFVTSQMPNRQTIATLTAAIAVTFLGAGLWSIQSAGNDASIGGGLLVMVALPLCVAALLLWRSKPSSV